ncbi:hypothetical protein OSC27_11640 [Microbacterium sp. STN6]|uniref:GNAT family N-acetyltransferase n=1 Tax=Microbacterium sp. STN6 TaxID=2995588 RepID=UPI002260C6F5|nr:GNAT family N-acetyltransferase [Microbacterium sp. STN6]MCX7522926.1 hypothetical protein [Microbacterium sp. STN6]
MSANASITVADCERMQTSWFRAHAEFVGGEVREDGPLTWILDSTGLHLMFPRELPADGLARGVAWARSLGTRIGVWLSDDVDEAPLAAAGFRRNWAPCWMTARLSDVGAPNPDRSGRVELQEESGDYRGRHAGYAKDLALTRSRPKRTWYAASYEPGTHAFTGRVWAHTDPALAGVTGIFDMAVWDPFRRQGYATDLLQVICATAAASGATDAVLNATPEGKLLYDRCGFEQIGAGITWEMPAPGLRRRVRRGLRRLASPLRPSH